MIGIEAEIGPLQWADFRSSRQYYVANGHELCVRCNDVLSYPPHGSWCNMFSSSYCLLLILLTQFVEADQKGTATKEPADAHSREPVAEAPLVTKAIDGLSTIKDVFTNVGDPREASDDGRNQAPTLVWVRMSREFLAKQMERDVDRKKPVRDYILGTTIRGESRTRGKTQFVLYPNNSQALGEVKFTGEVHSRTVGRNGPAILDYKSDSTFQARKRVTIGESGLSTSAAIADAPTRLTATNIRTNLPELRDRIVRRIAWRRVANSRSEADAIASDHTADDIRHDLDRKLDESVASIQNKIQTQLAKLQGDGKNGSLMMRSRSTPDYVEVALCRRSKSSDKIEIPSFPMEGNPEIAVRVHRTVLVLAMSDPQIREMVAPLMSNALKKPLLATAVGPNSHKAGLQVASFSTGGEWTALDFTFSSGEAPSPRTAIAEDSDGKQIR